jgi:hypothetical protein
LDGHARHQACIELGIEDIPAVVRPGMTEMQTRQYVLKMNMLRRHLDQMQKRRVIQDRLLAEADMSDRQIGRLLGVDHKTVGSVRSEMEERGEIPHLSRTTDTLGRKQPRRLPLAVASEGRDSSPPEEVSPGAEVPFASDHPPSRPPGQESGATEGTDEQGHRGGAVVPEAPQSEEEEARRNLLREIEELPFEEVAHRFTGIWLSNATPADIVAAVVEHLDKADQAELTLRLVLRGDFNASLAISRLTDDEQDRCPSAFLAAWNKVKKRRGPAGGEPSPEHVVPGTEVTVGSGNVTSGGTDG